MRPSEPPLGRRGPSLGGPGVMGLGSGRNSELLRSSFEPARRRRLRRARFHSGPDGGRSSQDLTAAGRRGRRGGRETARVTLMRERSASLTDFSPLRSAWGRARGRSASVPRRRRGRGMAAERPAKASPRGAWGREVDDPVRRPRLQGAHAGGPLGCACRCARPTAALWGPQLPHEGPEGPTCDHSRSSSGIGATRPGNGEDPAPAPTKCRTRGTRGSRERDAVPGTNGVKIRAFCLKAGLRAAS